MLQVELGLSAPEELGVLGDRPGPPSLDEPDPESVELTGDQQLVRHREGQALLLGAVSQRRVIDVEAVVHADSSFGWATGRKNKKTPRGTREVCTPAADCRALCRCAAGNHAPGLHDRQSATIGVIWTHCLERWDRRESA